MSKLITDTSLITEPCNEVDVRKNNKDVRAIVVEMKNVVREHNLTCLTANQIGYNMKIFCINFNGDIRTFVNPYIANVDNFNLARETCVSLPGREFIIPRYDTAVINYQTPLGKLESRKLIGLAAHMAQQCVDMLECIFLDTLGLEVDDQFDNASEDEKLEVIKAYLDSLEVKQEELEKEIKESKELSELEETAKTIQKISEGEMVIRPIEKDIDNNEE